MAKIDTVICGYTMLRLHDKRVLRQAGTPE